jgi:hypothetical protein
MSAQAKNLIILFLSLSILYSCNGNSQEETDKEFKGFSYIGEKPEGSWIFYDREHPYMLKIVSASDKNVNSFNSKDYTKLEEFSVNGKSVKKLRFWTIYTQCPSIIYLFINKNKIYTIQYPDCGVDEKFHKTAREFVIDWIKKEL